MYNQDTIAAISTAPGIGGIAVIRVSGKQAFEFSERIFSKELKNKKSHTVHFGTIKNKNGVLIDEVIATVYELGKSFTGEETVEFGCHGSVYIQQEILKTLIEVGCRMANPGEFTQRAFLNGQMDLTQAEAVADLIHSQSEKSHGLALKQMRGGITQDLSGVRDQLIHFASMIELELDFGEEDVEFANRDDLKLLVFNLLQKLNRLKQSFELGNALKNGVPVAIVGAPNAGKSTLLNQLLGEEKAIVSNIAGTTRDAIEDVLTIEGIVFRLIDTAGIREGAEEIEKLGIERTFEKIETANIVLYIADASNETDLKKASDEILLLKEKYPLKSFLLIGNKNDAIINEIEYQKNNSNQGKIDLSISAKHNIGIDGLKRKLVDLTLGDYNLQEETILTNLRHVESLQNTITCLDRVEEGLEIGITGDFIAMDIRQSLHHLGLITGVISVEDLLGSIFSRFCIGK